MSKISALTRQQILADIEHLKEDASFKLSASDMSAYLGRSYREYEDALANREQFNPLDALSAFGRNYADRTADLMKRITFALNANRITTEETETEKQKERRYAFMSEAEQLLQVYHSEFVFDADMDIPQQWLADAAYLKSYHDEPIGFRFYNAYRALEGYEVYLCERAEDNQINQANTLNRLQQVWLTRLLGTEPPTNEAQSNVILKNRIAKMQQYRGGF
ncbi:hypothetical protein [Neorhizobium sp. T7_12]|uniref:hypothetical protein n=1 Tax=Neorhizobium sp. T7_12 TaxID=2093832 RepID=UPI000CF9E286|nr:hypothetical protein [Neorhizobium sp. T7_12]